MSTPKNKEERGQHQGLGSLADYLPGLKKRGNPPNLRQAQTTSRCSDCVQFSYVSGRAWRGDGECSKYDAFVKNDFVCDSFEDE